MLTVKIISVIQLYKFYKYIYFAETNHGQKQHIETHHT